MRRSSSWSWEVRDGAALDAIGARLASPSVATTLMTRDLAEQRGVTAALVAADPVGNRLGSSFTDQRPGRDGTLAGPSPLGFRAGALGMGHIVLNVARCGRPAAVLPGGARLPARRPMRCGHFKTYFLQRNARHPQPGADREQGGRACTPDDGSARPRRHGPGLRPGAARARSGRDHARPALQRSA